MSRDHLINNNRNSEKKFIFIHIPKTAGMAIASAIGIKSASGKIDPKHFKGFEIKNILERNNDSIDNYFTFAFTRNPWDRLLSLYFYCHKGSEMFGMKKRRFNGSFEDFCRMAYSEQYFRNYAIYPLHYIPQVRFIDGAKIDFVGKFENLQEDFNTVCDKIRIPQKKLPHKNKSGHKHYTEYYNDETRAIVAEKYAKDIERFGYEFGE